MLKGLVVVGPVGFMAMAALPLPSQWKFIGAACLGAFIGTNARLCLELFSESINQKKALSLAFASFWLGVTGAFVSYLFGIINGYDPLKVTAAAAFSSLFGILLEMLGQVWLKSKAEKANGNGFNGFGNGITNSGADSLPATNEVPEEKKD